MLVILTYLAVVSGGTMIRLVVTWYGSSGLTLTLAVVAGLAAYMLLTLGIPYSCYRYAVCRDDPFTFE